MNRFSKKFAVLAMACVICFSLAACGSNKAATDSKSAGQTTNQTTVADTEASTQSSK